MLQLTLMNVIFVCKVQRWVTFRSLSWIILIKKNEFGPLQIVVERNGSFETTPHLNQLLPKIIQWFVKLEHMAVKLV